jgi:hypothetical protein
METNPISRIANRLLERSWTIFAFELLLVVVGILIALAIDGWNADREDRRSEQAYLELLVRDLGQIESQLQEQIAFETGIATAAVALHDLIQNKDPAQHSSQIGKMLTGIASRRTLVLDSAAYTDLISTGNLGLIQDRDLRDRIIRYFADSERRELIVEKNNRVFIDESFVSFVVDLGVSYYLWKDSPIAAALSLDIIDETFSQGMREPTDEVLSLPREAPEWGRLRQRLTWRAMVSLADKGQAMSMLANAIELREALEAHLAKN